jgi:DNA processing protein
LSAKTVSPIALTTNRSNQIGWIALTLTPGLGPTRSRKLIEFFGSIEGVLNASLTSLEAAGLPVAAAQSLGTGKSLELARDEIAKADAAGVQLVPMDDPLYPSRLRQIYDPPLVLYVRGNVDALAKHGIAVIGTRHPTPYGTGMSERLAHDLAARGLVIFSGLARGVDTAAHRGAVSAKGKTAAVFGTGSNKAATFTPCPATSPTRIRGDRTR